jgi:hypothetical protein
MAQLLDERTRLAVGLTAGLLGKCQPCFRYFAEQAQRAGLSTEFIREVVQMAEGIRGKGDMFMKSYVDHTLGARQGATAPAPSASTQASAGGCCGPGNGGGGGCC